MMSFAQPSQDIVNLVSFAINAAAILGFSLTQLRFNNVALLHSTGEQDQLGDLLTRILDDSGKMPALSELHNPHLHVVDLDSLDCHALATELAACTQRLTQQISTHSL